MKNLKITFAIICILGVLFVLTGCTKQDATKEEGNEVYLETIKLKYEGKNEEAYDLISKQEDSNDKYIQYLLGDFYYYGYGAEANYETASNTTKSRQNKAMIEQKT